MDSRPITSAAVAIDIESLCVRVCLFANVKPPLQDTVDRKFCRIMTCSEIYESSIIPNIVYAVWGYRSQFLVEEIVIKDFTSILLPAVFLAVVLEVSKVFFLLAVN